VPNHADIRDLSSLIKAVQDFSPARRKNFHFNIVKRRQRTHAASGGASEALPHEVGARPSRSEPKLNTHALYPSRSELRGITFKNKIQNDRWLILIFLVLRPPLRLRSEGRLAAHTEKNPK